MSNRPYKIISPRSEEEFANYFQFRWEQLRKPLNLPLGSERDEFESSAFHRMAITKNQKVIAVGRIHFDAKSSTRIRYMATDEPFRGKGIGGQILQDLIAHASANDATLCWLKAREQACEFYLRYGFEKLDEVHSDLSIKHIKMQRALP